MPPDDFNQIKYTVLKPRQKQKKKPTTYAFYLFYAGAKRKQLSLFIVSGLLHAGSTAFLLCPAAFHSSYLLTWGGGGGFQWKS